MRANNLTISLPCPPCTKNCPFCVSKMTFSPRENLELFYDETRINKVLNYADKVGVSSILITSKNEPFDNIPGLENIISIIGSSFPIEIQTNGLVLNHQLKLFTNSSIYNNIDIIAISISNIDELEKLKTLFLTLSKNKVVRLTVILSDRWESVRLKYFINKCNEYNISQLTFRQPTIPYVSKDDGKSKEIQNWIRLHNNNYDHILKDIKGDLIRELSFGASVVDIESIAVTKIDYCIQENHKDDDLRSLIYHHDGHLYTSWDKKSSILF